MSFGPDANAYTDFGHTVYTFHAPISQELKEQRRDVYNIIEVLFELVFKALLLPDQIQTER